MRGGSFDNPPENLRSANRDDDNPTNRDRNNGFRCVRVPPQHAAVKTPCSACGGASAPHPGPPVPVARRPSGRATLMGLWITSDQYLMPLKVNKALPSPAGGRGDGGEGGKTASLINTGIFCVNQGLGDFAVDHGGSGRIAPSGCATALTPVPSPTGRERGTLLPASAVYLRLVL